MRNLFFLLILILMINLSDRVEAQLLFEENFEYEPGSLSLVGIEKWSPLYTGGEALVVDGNLAYIGYLSSSIGRMLYVSDTLGLDYSAVIPGSPSEGKIYCSFLLNVINENGLKSNFTSGEYFFNFKSGSTNFNLLLIKKGFTSDAYQLGIAKRTDSIPVFLSDQLNYSTTYLVVISYSFIPGDSNDEIKLWINPELNGTEPVGNIIVADSLGDIIDVDKIIIRQNADTPNGYIDGIRVAGSWSDAPVPVELIDFFGEAAGDRVVLHWNTATEVNNLGFRIQRKNGICPGDYADWENIGFVPGHGNSNSPKSYSYTDYPKGGDNFNYRLKQIDFDGSFEYSDPVNVTLALPNLVTLQQNFPNPFNPETTIKFSIPGGVEKLHATSLRQVSLIVYDILGREVTTLINEMKFPGNYEIKFDAGKLTNGVYFYRLRAGDLVMTKKMILLR